MTAVRGLLLDFGSVISASLFERHAGTETTLGLPPGTLTWRGPLAPESDALWQRMQSGAISERDYWATRADEIGRLVGERDWTMLTLLVRTRAADPDAVVRPEMLSLIRRASAAGFRLGILSNELELFYGRAVLDRMSVMRSFDAIVDATHTKILKPDPRAYALGVDALGLRPGEILFVDDQPGNVAGAERAGLRAQWFDIRDVAGSIRAIERHLALPPVAP